MLRAFPSSLAFSTRTRLYCVCLSILPELKTFRRGARHVKALRTLPARFSNRQGRRIFFEEAAGARPSGRTLEASSD
jgi:hypothetical protein